MTKGGQGTNTHVCGELFLMLKHAVCHLILIVTLAEKISVLVYGTKMESEKLCNVSECTWLITGGVVPT